MTRDPRQTPLVLAAHLDGVARARLLLGAELEVRVVPRPEVRGPLHAAELVEVTAVVKPLRRRSLRRSARAALRALAARLRSRPSPATPEPTLEDLRASWAPVLWQVWSARPDVDAVGDDALAAADRLFDRFVDAYRTTGPRWYGDHWGPLSRSLTEAIIASGLAMVRDGGGSLTPGAARQLERALTPEED